MPDRMPSRIQLNYGLPDPGESAEYIEIWYRSTAPFAVSTNLPATIDLFGNGPANGTAYQNFTTNPTSVQVNTTIIKVRIDHSLQFATSDTATASTQYQRAFEKFSNFYWVSQRKTYGNIPLYDLINQNIYNLGVEAGRENDKRSNWYLLQDYMELVPGGNTPIQIAVAPGIYTLVASTAATTPYLPGLISGASLGFDVTCWMYGVELQPLK